MAFPSEATACDFYPSNLIKKTESYFSHDFGDKRDSLNIIWPHTDSITRSASAWGPGNKERKTHEFNAETTSSGMLFWKKRILWGRCRLCKELHNRKLLIFFSL